MEVEMLLPCVNCDRPILSYNKKLGRYFKPDKDHDLCRRCWQAEVDRERTSKKKRSGGWDSNPRP